MRPGLRFPAYAAICCLYLVAAVTVCSAQGGRLLLGGRLVTTSGIAAHGWLELQNGRIIRIYAEKPELVGVPALETDDFICPGFIDWCRRT